MTGQQLAMPAWSYDGSEDEVDAVDLPNPMPSEFTRRRREALAAERQAAKRAADLVFDRDNGF